MVLLRENYLQLNSIEKLRAINFFNIGHSVVHVEARRPLLMTFYYFVVLVQGHASPFFAEFPKYLPKMYCICLFLLLLLLVTMMK